MKIARPQHSSRPAPSREVAALRARLADAEETLRAIRSGEVDAVVVAGKRGPQVFTLQGAEHAYRVLIESMNEGALTLTADAVILYANRRFAKMLKRPLGQVMGSDIRRFLSAEDQATLLPLLRGAGQAASKIQVCLIASDGSQRPAQISLCSLPKHSVDRTTLGLVVTDMTEARRTEKLLRTLTRRVVQAQEDERRRVARELHDHITQLVCAILVRSQALAVMLSPRDGPARREAIKLREMLGQTAEAVERVSRDLLPSILEHLGLAAVLRGYSEEFAQRTGVSVKLACAPLRARLPAETELALYRIVQKALHNVERHAQARHVTVRVQQPAGFVQLTIQDDGIGFDPEHLPSGKDNGGIGLFRMQERAAYVGGALEIKSARGAGTEIRVRIPLPAGALAAHRTDL